MATSPIYGWLEPDNTDLVRNGALAIRTLGNAIDTTMGTMTPKSIVDAKGDLIAASANDTPARLAVGNNGETLVADSSTSTGLRYTGGTVISNPVINSAMQIWQRGTSISVAASTNAYTADRWMAGTSANQACTISRQATGDTTNLPNIQYALRFQRNSGQTGTAAISLYNNFETINSIPFVGKTVTFSFYARAGANYSSTSNALVANFFSGTGTDQNVITGYTGLAYVATTTATLTTTWQRFSVTGTVATSATELNLGFTWTPTGTAGANDYFETTGIQVDVGSVALPFRTYAATIQGELSACQRYYYRISTNASTALSLFGTGVSSTAVQVPIQYPVTMRTVPALSDYGGTFRVVDGVSAFNLTTPTLTLVNITASNAFLNANGATGLTQYRPYALSDQGSGTGYYGISAEL
jgi:hypothetical protein